MNSPLNWLYKSKISVTILITFLIIAIVPVGVGLTSYFFTTRHAIETSAVQHLETLAMWEAKLVREWFNKHISALRTLSNSPEIRSGDWTGAGPVLQGAKQLFPEFSSFAVVNTEGKIVYDTAGKTGIDVSDRSYFKAGIQSEEYISEMIVARNSDRPTIILSVPVKTDEKVIGLLIGSVDVEALNNIMGFAIGETGESFLVDRKGNLITLPMTMRREGVDPSVIIQAPENQCIEEGLKGIDGVIRFYDYKENKIIGVRKWLPDLEILLITKQDKSEALEDTGGWGLTLSLIAGNGILFLTLPAIWYISRRISRPLIAITTAVNEIASGNLSHRVQYIKANQEIELLAQQINGMASTMEDSMKLIGEQVSELEAQKEEISAQNDDLLRAYDQLSQANESLQQLATTDQLTEIYNRRYFMHRLQTEILISLRSRRPFTVALVDIDYFKSINDTYGHKAGDQILKGLVKVVAENIRRTDILARFGGEEFIILAPETSLHGGVTLAEKIRTAVAMHDFQIEGRTLNITISIGVAELNDFSESPEKTEDNLIHMADQYLYQAKRNGRNRVEGGPQSPTDAI